MTRRRRDIYVRAAVAALLFASGAWAAQAQVAATASPSPHPHGEVTIYRDAKGVPHIDGSNSAAVMYGAGYTLAQDRLVELELSRRRVQGRRAEILGRGALPGDIEARDRQISAAELMRMYATLPAEHQAMLQALVDGINLGIAEIQKDPAHKTPYEFVKWGIQATPWTLLDFLGSIIAAAWSRATSSTTSRS